MLRRRKTTVLIAPILLLSLVLSGCLGGNGGEKVTYFELQVGVSGSGSVSPLAGKQKYAEGTVVTLAATPTPDWEFRYWIGEVSDPYSPETELVVDGEKSVTAVFYKRR
ncbi:MAG: InlB B-repeat-containing protein [Limnochordia bacterium]